jgi:hypothetical protein
MPMGFKYLKKKGQKAWDKTKKKAKKVADATGLSEMAEVRHHMPTKPKRMDDKKRLVGSLYLKSPPKKKKEQWY